MPITLINCELPERRSKALTGSVSLNRMNPIKVEIKIG